MTRMFRGEEVTVLTEANQKQLDRIRKLLQKAEAAGVTESEAIALNAKAQELAARYEINDAVIRSVKGRDSNDKLEVRIFTVGKPYTYQLQLAYHVYLNNGCQGIKLTGLDAKRKPIRNRLEVVGFKSDLDRADLFWTSLSLQAASAAVNGYREYVNKFVPWSCIECDCAQWKSFGGNWYGCAECEDEFLSDSPPTNKPDRRPTWYRSFWQSWSQVVIDRIEESRARLRKEVASESSGTEIVLRDRDLAVREELEKRHPEMRRGRNPIGSRGSGHAAGAEAGRRADLGHGRLSAQRKSIER